MLLLNQTKLILKQKILLEMQKGHNKRVDPLEDITIVHIYASNNTEQKCIKQKLTVLKGETDNSTIIAEDFNTSLSIMDR